MGKQEAIRLALKECSALWSHSTHGQIAFHSKEGYETYLKTIEKYRNGDKR